MDSPDNPINPTGDPEAGNGKPNRRGGAPKANRNAEKSGLSRMKRALKELGSRGIDRRTAVGRALAQWRQEVIADITGKDNPAEAIKQLSAQQLAILDLASRTKLMIDSVDAWILQQPSLVNARKRAIMPAVKERAQLADSLARYLGLLGIEKKSTTRDVQGYLASKMKQQQDAKGEQA